MKSFVYLILNKVTDFPKLCLGLVASVFFLLVTQIPKIEVIENIDYFHIEELQSTKEYQRLKDLFGDDEFFIILLESEDLFATSTLKSLSLITEEISSLPEVKKARSLTNIEEIKGNQDYFEVGKLLTNLDLDSKDKTSLKNKLISNPLYQKTISNENLNALAILVWPNIDPNDDSFRKRLLGKVDKILNDAKGKNFDLEFTQAGWTITNVALSKYSKEDLEKFIPLCFLVMLAFISFAFRSLFLTFIAAVNMCVSLTCVMAFFPILGISLTHLSSAAIPVILALTLADTIHLFNYFRELAANTGKSPLLIKAQVFNILKVAIWPCLLTSTTTCLGFLSFSTSALKPLVDFGIIAAVGMIIEVICSFTIIPSLILISKHPSKYFTSANKTQTPNAFLHALTNFIILRRQLIIIAFSVFCVSFIMLIPQIDVNTSIVDYLDDSLPERKAVTKVEANLGGLQTFEVVLYGKEKNTFKKPDNLRVLESVHEEISIQPEVSKVHSFAPFIKEMNKAFHEGNKSFYEIPNSEEAIVQYLLIYDSSETEDLILPDYSAARLNVRTTLKKSRDEVIFLNKLKADLRNKVPEHLELVITGRMVDQVAVSNSIVSGQVESLATALIFISIVMIFALKSLALGLLSLVPNLIPVLGSFAFMSLSGTPLDTGTALIASVVLGIAVDDTIHFLLNFQKERQKNSLENSVRNVMCFKGVAISITSLVLSFGFAVLCFGNFVPTQDFGYLTAVVMLFAPIADLLLLPALLLCFPRVSKNANI